ncbi:Subtilisin-like protease SBT6.1 [Camellia lanceoleosa]|uniref:Subtilisin-like protease SBT6.1 n=1 Tax=Camellia lanceoleosa TaxID=1840588 RepID=A0ACC0FI90_9ERIC|nr:Subtilisin-like protease SBT6.1 [Camellia lanceoleosa]
MDKVASPPTWHPSNEVGNLLSIHFTYSDVIWPWTGYHAVYLQIKEEGAQFSGEIEGNVTIDVYSPRAQGEKGRRISTRVLRLKLKVVPTPPRSNQVLWDQFHSIKYPPGYIPIRDTLLVDLEDEYFAEEIKKLRDDVINTGIGLVVFAEWYNVDTMAKLRCNVPALNDLLSPFGIAFGDKILNGDFSIDSEQSRYASGTNIVKFPRGGYVHSFSFLDASEIGATQNILSSDMTMADSPILGLVEVDGGRIAVYGDSNCLDSSHMILDFTSKNIKDSFLLSDSVRQDKPLYQDDKQLPSRRTDVNFSTYSAVVRKELICESDSRVEVGETKGYGLFVRGRDRRLPGCPVIDLRRGLNSTTEDSRIKRSQLS